MAEKLTALSLFTAIFLLVLRDGLLVEGCLLCPLHIPSRPKPLNQFRLPSIQKILDTADSIHGLCDNETIISSLNLTPLCKADVSHLSCSLKELVASFKRECPGSENAQECATCRRESEQAYSKNSWILKWIDSIGKMPAGISDGNYHWLGDYEQCVLLKTENHFNGQYCLLQFKVPDTVLALECDHSEPLEVSLGICLPASCSTAETAGVAEYVADHQIDVHCQPPILWSLPSKIFLTVIVCWLGTVLTVSIVVWLFNISADDSRNRWLMVFSIQRNLKNALRSQRISQEFSAIQGIQVSSAVLFVFGSCFIIIMPYLENVSYFYGILESFAAQPMVNYSFYADGLFALFAFKMAYKLTRDTTWSPLLVIGKQLVKIWPAYAFCTLFMALIYARLGEGPMWSHSDMSDRCEHSWLSNLLLLNNIFGYRETCLDAGFIFSLEIQFFVVLLLTVAAARRWRRPLLLLVCVFICASLFYIFFIAFVYRTAPTLIPASSSLVSFREGTELYRIFVNALYLNPFARCVPFLLGLLIPLQFRRLDFFQKSSGREYLVPLFWALAFTSFGLIIWTPYFLEATAADDTSIGFIEVRSISALYSSVHRTLWAIMLILMVIILNRSNNSLNTFFSWRVFYPMSKLVYVMILVSEPVSVSLFSSLHRPIYTTPLYTMMASLGTVFCSFLIALMIDLCLSRPIRQIFENSVGSSSTAESAAEAS